MATNNSLNTIVDTIGNPNMPFQYKLGTRSQPIAYNPVTSSGEAMFSELPEETIYTHQWTWRNAGGEDMHLIIVIETDKPIAAGTLFFEDDEVTIKFGSGHIAPPAFGGMRQVSFKDDESQRTSLSKLMSVSLR